MALHVRRSAGLLSQLRVLQALKCCAIDSQSTSTGVQVHAHQQLAGQHSPATAAGTAGGVSGALALFTQPSPLQQLRNYAVASAATAAESEGEGSAGSEQQVVTQGAAAADGQGTPQQLRGGQLAARGVRRRSWHKGQQEQGEQEERQQQEGAQRWRQQQQQEAQQQQQQQQQQGEEQQQQGEEQQQQGEEQQPPSPPPPKVDPLVPKMVNATSVDAVQWRLERAASKGRRLSIREATAAMQALGRLGDQNREASEKGRAILAGIFVEFAEQFGCFDARGLASAVWAAAKVGYCPTPEQKAAWANAARSKLNDFNVILASNVLFSFGKLYWLPDEELVHAFVRIALQHAEELTGQLTANVLWGLGRTRYNPGPAEVAQLVEQTLPQLGTFDTQATVSILFSLAVLRMELSPKVASAYLDALEPRLSAASSRQLCMLIWALGNLNLADHVTDSIWQQLDDALLAKLPTSQPQRSLRVPLVLFGAARLKRRPSPELVEMLLREAEQCMRSMTSRDAGGVLWALARFNFKVGDGNVSAHLLHDLLGQLQDLMARGQALSRHVAGALWGLAALELPLEESDLAQFTRFLDAQYTAGGTGIATPEATQLLTAFEHYQHNPGILMLKRHITAHERLRAEAQDSELAAEEEEEEGNW